MCGSGEVVPCVPSGLVLTLDSDDAVHPGGMMTFYIAEELILAGFAKRHYQRVGLARLHETYLSHDNSGIVIHGPLYLAQPVEHIAKDDQIVLDEYCLIRCSESDLRALGSCYLTGFLGDGVCHRQVQSNRLRRLRTRAAPASHQKRSHNDWQRK